MGEQGGEERGGGEDMKVTGQGGGGGHGSEWAGRSCRRRMNMIYCVKFLNK